MYKDEGKKYKKWDKRRKSSLRGIKGFLVEREVQEELETEGWLVIRRGKPDFICLRRKDNGDWVLKFVECKSGKRVTSRSTLGGEQGRVAKLLRNAGFEVEVVWRKEPNHTK